MYNICIRMNILKFMQVFWWETIKLYKWLTSWQDVLMWILIWVLLKPCLVTQMNWNIFKVSWLFNFQFSHGKLQIHYKILAWCQFNRKDGKLYKHLEAWALYNNKLAYFISLMMFLYELNIYKNLSFLDLTLIIQ